MPHDDLIAVIAARLDQATMRVMQSRADTAEQHAIIGDLAFVHTMLRLLRSAPADRVAVVAEAMALSVRVSVPKTASPAVSWPDSDYPRPGEWGDVERRAFLALAATMAGLPVIEALAGLPDNQLVTVLQQVTDHYRERLRTMPGAVVYGALLRHEQEIDSRAKQAGEPLRSGLLGVLAETSGLAGTVAFFDFGRRGDAARHFATATDAARESDDLDRLAYSYDRVAFHLQFAGRPAEAINVHQRAARECVREPASLMACTLAKEQAVNFALLGEEKQALILLDEAYWAREQADAAEASPVWAEDATRLEATAGYVRTILNRPDAEDTLHIAQARAGRDDALQSTILAALAEVYAGKGEPEQAAEVAAASLAIATMLGSLERKRRVLRPWRRLEPHQNVRAVRELGEQLRAAGLTAA
jgi:hypothetical protein